MPAQEAYFRDVARSATYEQLKKMAERLSKYPPDSAEATFLSYVLRELVRREKGEK